MNFRALVVAVVPVAFVLSGCGLKDKKSERTGSRPKGAIELTVPSLQEGGGTLTPYLRVVLTRSDAASSEAIDMDAQQTSLIEGIAPGHYSISLSLMEDDSDKALEKGVGEVDVKQDEVAKVTIEIK